MSTVMGPKYKLTQADIAVNYYLVLGVGARWGNDDIQKHIVAYDKAYGGFIPTRHHERAFWYLRRRAREVLLSPLREAYDKQRRLWYLGAHGTHNDLIMLKFESCPDFFYMDAEVDLWSCIHAFIFHCTPLPKLRIGGRHMILAHFVWASRTLLLQYWRNRSEDKLADSIQGAYNVSYKYMEALKGLCGNNPLWTDRQWRRLLDILTQHNMVAAFRHGERRAWLFFTVKFLEALYPDSEAKDIMIQELEMAGSIDAQKFLDVSADMVVMGKHLAHQIPWGPDYKDACAAIGRKPRKDFKLPWYEGEELSRAFTAWYAHMRQRLVAGESFTEWDAEDLAALWQEYLGESAEAYACSTNEFPPRPRFLNDHRVIRAETEAAMASYSVSSSARSSRRGRKSVTTPDLTPDVTPHATPHLSATEGALLPAEKFDLDSRRMSPDDLLLLALNDEKAYFADKRRGKMKATEPVAEPETPRGGPPHNVREVSVRLRNALEKTVNASRTWKPEVEEQVAVWREEHGYEHAVPRIPASAFKTIKDEVVRKNAEELVNDLRRAYEINAYFARENLSAPDMRKNDDDGDVFIAICDAIDAEFATDALATEYPAPKDKVHYDEVVTIPSEDDYEALAIGDISDTYKRPTSIGRGAPVDTSGNLTQIDIDDDPFAFHGGSSSTSRRDDMEMPPTPRPSHLPPPPGLGPLPVIRRLHASAQNSSDSNASKLQNATRERENKDLEEAYDALAKHATLVDKFSSSSDSDSDSDEGWGDAEILYNSVLSQDPKETNDESPEPVSREGATSRAGHREDKKSSKTSKIKKAVNNEYDDFRLSDGEDDENEEHKKGKVINVRSSSNKKEAGKSAQSESLPDAGIGGKPDPWTDPHGYHKWRCATTSNSSKVAPVKIKTPGDSSAGIAPPLSMKSGRGASLLRNDGDRIVPIVDLTGANATEGASAARA